MPSIAINGARLHYEVTGDGRDTILFIHGLMLASDSWAAQRDYFATTHRVVTYDLRGQGRSEHTRDRLDLDSLAEDAAALIEALQIAPCHVVGFSMGAFIAMRLAARHPGKVRSLALIGPSAEAEEKSNRPRYLLMMALVTLFGPRPLAGRMMQILFGDTFLRDPNRAAERRQWRQVVDTLPRSVVRAASASAGRRSIVDELPAILAPTLVISGAEDRPISPALARAVADNIAGAVFHPFAETGHAVMIERAGAFNALLDTWIETVRQQRP